MRNLQMAYSMGLKGLSRPVVRIQSSQMLLVPTLCGSRVNSFVRNMGSRSYQQHVLTKNLTLVTTQGGLKVGKDHEVTLLSDLEKTRPLVVLLSWLLAKQKHILKFADFYLDQGFDVLTVSIQPWQMLLPARGTQVLGADLLRFLHINGCYQPLMLHGFSVGGYVWAETLVKINEDLKKYQPTIDRFVGQVWDSVADITEIPVGFPKAVFPNNPILQAATEKYVRYHMSAFHNIATCHYIRASQMFYTTVIRSPALFFLSKTDPVGSIESITRCRDSWDAQGIKTYMKCWDKSPHVLHYRHHPKEYAAELYAFMDRLGMLANPEKFRAKL
ncbi:hypothetical protein R5R35_011971 [Gryllus longicercus]|uniref:Transmembrane protein 53 n=1 Tax=Gryllus longicercus TaxID=2509291 RepID=A0AAN9VRF4_9ORTH